jgi:hypothetical protein
MEIIVSREAGSELLNMIHIKGAQILQKNLGESSKF